MLYSSLINALGDLYSLSFVLFATFLCACAGHMCPYMACVRAVHGHKRHQGRWEKEHHSVSACGVATYQLIRNLVTPGKPTNHSFEELVKQVTDHLTPPPSAIMQRYKFNSRAQKEGETVADYVAELRHLSEHCKFENLDEMLRDWLVCGIRDVQVQRRLLAEVDLDFKNAFEFAQAAEWLILMPKYCRNPALQQCTQPRAHAGRVHVAVTAVGAITLKTTAGSRTPSVTFVGRKDT